MLYIKLNRPDSAKIFLRRCYEVAMKESNYRYKAESLVVLGRQANDEGRYLEALGYSIESKKNALEVRSRLVLEDAYYELFRSKRGLNDFEGAALSWDKYLVYHDSLFSESLSVSLISMHIDFEQEQNETRLALQESIVRWQDRRNTWIVGLGGLLFIFIGLLIYDFTSRKRENEMLESVVRDRTRALEEKIRSLEREEAERRTWEQRIDKSVRNGITQLDALTTMTGKKELNDALSAFHNNG